MSVGLLSLLAAGCGGGGGGGGDSGSGSADTTPDTFSFAVQPDMARSTAAASNEIVVTGLTGNASISITGGEYSIDGGAFTSAAGTVANNQRIRVRVTSSPQFSTPVTATLTIGGVSAAFTVTTVTADTTPNTFEFQKVGDATRGSSVTSHSVTITGIEVPVAISIADGEYSIDGGAFTSAPGTIGEGQSLTVRASVSTNYSSATLARVTVGTATVEFEVISEVPDYVPDSVVFDGQDIVYLLSHSYGLVFRWSLNEERYLDAYPVGTAGSTPPKMAYSSAHQRLYLGFSAGGIQYVDVTSQNKTLIPFANLSGVGGLVAVGNYLLAQGAGGSHSVLDSAGGVTSQGNGYSNYPSREYAWDPTTSRVYFFRDNTSPNDLHYEVIDQATGRIGATGETPYHGGYSIQPPIRISSDGQHVLLGSGDIYNQNGLTWAASVGAQVTDARWFADQSVLTLTTATNQTTLRRLRGANLANVEQRTYIGQGLRVVGTDSKMAVLVINDGALRIRIYVPNNDSDSDGVTNTQDAFPLDAAAAVDTDRDGYPDAWNAGRTQSDSTTGLSLDAYPQDAACYLLSHGDGVNCDYGATIPSYTPDQVVSQGDTIYLLSTANRRVYRWSIGAGRYLNPFVVGINRGFDTLAPTKMAYSSAHGRLYLGYTSGAIRYIDLAAGSVAEVEFTNTAMGLGGLAAVGNYVMAQDDSGAWGTHYVFSSTGALVTNVDWNYYSREYAYDPVTSRVYFFRDGFGPNDLHYEVVDQTTGQITSEGETPYHGDYSIQPPIRVSANGQYVLLGSGDIYHQNGLTWAGSIGSQITDARWLADGTLVTLTTASNQTTLRRLGTNRATLEQLTYSGTALRVVGSDARMTVIVSNSGIVEFHNYVPSNDSDGDGVPNTADAFPLDPAASVDSDHDGYPDAWNPGRDDSDSTTGLTLDAYPTDAACYLDAHGDGVNCDYDRVIPDYVPDQVVQHGDIVYLLSNANRRVYRWSITTGGYLSPYAVGIDQGYSTIAPIKMAYSSAHQRLYLGYSTGAIRYIDVSSGNAAEMPFTNTAMGIGGLAAVGNYLLAQDGSGAWGTHYIIDSSGTITDQPTWTRYSREFAWDPVTSRVYFFRDNTSPNDLHYEVVDQSTGRVTSSGETPYHGAYNIQPPIRVAANGQHVLLGSGDLYNQNGLTWAGSIGAQVADARWSADGSLVTLTTAGNQTTLRRLHADRTVLEQLNYTGQALRIVGSDTRMALLVIDNGSVAFHVYVPNDDNDNDGVTNNVDAFPLDPAASLDSDRDGYPDTWNAGQSQSDSTTGLSLDAYPLDSGCYLVSHGSGGICNPAATVPNYVPDQVLSDGDTIYLLSSANRRVYRWSITTATYLNPYVVGVDQGVTTLAPSKMAYSSAHQRLYLGYSSGAIRYIDVSTSNPEETHFATTAMGVQGLAAVGDFVLAQDASGAWESHYVFDAVGVLTALREWNTYSGELAWDPVSSRVYYFRDGSSPNDLMYEVIDQVTGEITASGESPYHGDYSIMAPIRVSVGGQYILLGSGDLYNQNDLTWARSLGTRVNDARWFADGSLVTLTSMSNQTTLRHLGSNLANVEQLTFAGQALRIVGSDARMAVVLLNAGTVQFQIYVPNNDIDNDGVANTVDAFPHDPAASIDSDHDGYPDAWNAGQSQSDSTTGLNLDAYPLDSACYLAWHGSGGICNPTATLPDYVPDQVVNDGDVIYLLSSANRRVYRWSMATGAYLNPYVVGIDQGFSILAPNYIAFSNAHQRLYLGYSTGAISYIDVGASQGIETPFANTAMGIESMASVGNYLLAQDRSGAWRTHYIFDAGGVIADQITWAYYSRDYAWDPVNSRIYFFRDGLSPNDLHFERIDQSTGMITAAGETDYHGRYTIQPPLRVSADGQQILLGSGDFYEPAGLTWTGSLGKAIKQAEWRDDLLIDLDTTGLLEIRNAETRAVLASFAYPGETVRMVFGQTEGYLVQIANGATTFVRLPFYDQDADLMPRWWEQRHGLSDSDPADALDDQDNDSVINRDEYLHGSHPQLPDSDADGIDDQQEIVTQGTHPGKADSDGDGLDDGKEVLTYHSDPLDPDSDDDNWNDLDEALYSGDPNDPANVPEPVTSLSESFENPADMTAWSLPPYSLQSFVVDPLSRTGSNGLKSGDASSLGVLQYSGIRFRVFTTAGTLRFYARTAGCCNHLQVFVDGVQTNAVLGNNPSWVQSSVPLTAGVHTIEWRYLKYSGSSNSDAAWIDDVTFTQ